MSLLEELTIERSALTELPAEIGNLQALKELSLVDNDLTVMPEELGNLSALTSMDLSNNKLAGEIPSSLGNLSITMPTTLLPLPSADCDGLLEPLGMSTNDVPKLANVLYGSIDCEPVSP